MAEPKAGPSALRKHVLDFDIDNYLNPICPRQRLYLLPNFVSHWFGYRAPDAVPQKRLPNLGAWTSALLGAFIGIAIITNVYQHLPMLGNHEAPVVIASFGAAAILEYNTIESPLSQPRNLIIGHFLSAVIGVAITKGFQRLPVERFEELRWLAGSIAVGVASLVMSATKTVHPPAGATALLASTSAEITVLGWWLLPLILLGSGLMCASALIVNNLTRRWPLYWWTPLDLSTKALDVEHRTHMEEHVNPEVKSDRSRSEADSVTKWESAHVENSDVASQSDATLNECRTPSQPASKQHVSHTCPHHQIQIDSDEIIMPKGWDPTDWEMEVLKILQDSLKRRTGLQQHQEQWSM